MTQDEAATEARRRWGTRAVVRAPPAGSSRYLVGFLEEGRACELWVGSGRSWEEAFRAADELSRSGRK